MNAPNPVVNPSDYRDFYEYQDALASQNNQEAYWAWEASVRLAAQRSITPYVAVVCE